MLDRHHPATTDIGVDAARSSGRCATSASSSDVQLMST